MEQEQRNRNRLQLTDNRPGAACSDVMAREGEGEGNPPPHFNLSGNFILVGKPSYN